MRPVRPAPEDSNNFAAGSKVEGEAYLNAFFPSSVQTLRTVNRNKSRETIASHTFMLDGDLKVRRKQSKNSLIDKSRPMV